MSAGIPSSCLSLSWAVFSQIFGWSRTTTRQGLQPSAPTILCSHALDHAVSLATWSSAGFFHPLATLAWLYHRNRRQPTRGKRHSKERQKSWRNYFGHFLCQMKGQVTRPRGNQRSTFAYFSNFRQTGAYLETEKLQCRAKAHSIALLTLKFGARCSDLTSDQRFSP